MIKDKNRIILPCPFCGETEDIDYGINYGTLYGFDYVQCQSCGAEIHAIHNQGKTIAAIDLWNRRVEYVTPLGWESEKMNINFSDWFRRN